MSMFDIVLGWIHSDQKAFAEHLAAYPKDRLQVRTPASSRCCLSWLPIEGTGKWRQAAPNRRWPCWQLQWSCSEVSGWCQRCSGQQHQDGQLLMCLQALVHRTQQLLTLSVLEGSPDEELEHYVIFLGILFDANQQSRSLPISDFYNDAGLSGFLFRIPSIMFVTSVMLSIEAKNVFVLTSCTVHSYERPSLMCCTQGLSLLLPSVTQHHPCEGLGLAPQPCHCRDDLFHICSGLRAVNDEEFLADNLKADYIKVPPPASLPQT